MKYLLTFLLICVSQLQAHIALPSFYSTQYSASYLNLPSGFQSVANIDINGPCLVALSLPTNSNPTALSYIKLLRFNGSSFTDITFTDTNQVQMMFPAAWYVGDVTGDSLQDIIIGGHGQDKGMTPGELVRILVQTADGKLLDETADRLPQNMLKAHDIAVADIDNSGTKDIFICAKVMADAAHRFYMNDGTGHFTDSTDRLPADVASDSDIWSCAFINILGEKYPDLVLGHGVNSQENILLINDGTGHYFKSGGYTLPPKPASLGKSVVTKIVAADLNGDGLPDLLLATTGGSIVNMYGQTVYGYTVAGLQVLLQQRDGSFIDVTEQSGITFNPNNDQWVRDIQVADIDGDGIPDLLLTVVGPNTQDYPGHSKVFLGTGAGKFIEQPYMLSLSGYAFDIIDLNKDGALDLLAISNKSFITEMQITERQLDPIPVTVSNKFNRPSTLKPRPYSVPMDTDWNEDWFHRMNTESVQR